MSKKYHYTYRITNIVEKKYYYGVHSCNCLPKEDIGVKYFSSSKNKAFKDDIKENPQNYKYKVVKIFSTRKEALEHEIFLHAKFNVGVNKKFYNGSKQGSTNRDTSGMSLYIDEFGNEHFVSIQDERVLTGEFKSYFTGENNGMYGRKRTDEEKQRISVATKLGMDKRKDKPWKQVISEETKKQISETLTGRIFVSKDGKNKNIYPEELEYYLSLGYERKMIKKKKNNDVRLFSDEFPEGILVEKEKVQEYLSNGYYKKTKITVTKNNKITTSIYPEQLEQYLSDGWEKGLKIKRKRRTNNTKGTKAVHKPDENKTKFIKINEIEEYLSKGYVLGSAKRK